MASRWVPSCFCGAAALGPDTYGARSGLGLIPHPLPGDHLSSSKRVSPEPLFRTSSPTWASQSAVGIACPPSILKVECALRAAASRRWRLDSECDQGACDGDGNPPETVSYRPRRSAGKTYCRWDCRYALTRRLWLAGVPPGLAGRSPQGPGCLVRV